MKLLVRDTKIIGTATDDYLGPEQSVDAPSSFDQSNVSAYSWIDGALQGPGIWSTLEARQRDMLAAVGELRTEALAVGARHEQNGLHVELTDRSRADLAGMAATALAASLGAALWPDSYALGWISVENVRIPLPQPADGLALAALAGQRYAEIIQHARGLKDAILSAKSDVDLDAIDIHAGWST